MTQLRKLTAVIIFSAAIAAPAFAKPVHHGRAHNDFRGSYDQMIGPSYAAPQSEDARTIVDFGFSGNDPSRVGGHDPNLNPRANSNRDGIRTQVGMRPYRAAGMAPGKF